jgi:L,D-transpeptidase catalytic domain
MILGRGLVASLAAACALCVAAGPALAAGIPAYVPATQQLAALQTAHDAHAAPQARSPRVRILPARTPITGERTTLPVIGHATASNGDAWLEVLLPGRPDGAIGWILARGTRALTTRWHLVVDLTTRRVSVYRDGHRIRVFRAVVGKQSTPTPTGQFFVQETLTMAPGEPGGPYALALSARSNVLREFEGGPGQIAVHGRDDLGGTLGAAESHGCMRLATASIDWLAARIGPGVPVSIYRG